MSSEFGALSVLPPLLAILTRKAVLSLFLGIWAGAVIFSGAIFGDHSSPISDTTVLSATFTGADLIDHVRTQLYYALTVAAVAVLLLLVWGFTRVTPLALLPVGVVLLIGLVYGLSELDADRKGLEPVVADAPQDAEPTDD